MVAVNLLAKILIFIICVAIVVYIVYKLLLPPPYISFLPLRHLTSLAGLACAIDVAGTQDPNVITCNQEYTWGSRNIFEEILRGMSLKAGFFSFYSPSYDVKCRQTYYELGKESHYVCLSRVGHRVEVKCRKDGSWKCKVIGFDLYQKAPVTTVKDCFERYSGGLAVMVCTLKIAGIDVERAVELPKYLWDNWIVKKDFFGANPIYFVWGLGVEDPQWMVFFETFPPAARSMYEVTPTESVLVTAATSVAFTAAVDLIDLGYGLAKGAFSKAGKKAAEKAFEVADNLPIWKRIPTKLRILGGKIKGFIANLIQNPKSVAKEAIGIIVVLAVLMMAVLVLAPLQNQAEQQVASLNDSQAQSTFQSIAQAGWGALNMFGIIPYIVVAIVIIGLLLRIAG